MKILHIVPGTDDVANGMVVVARLLAKEQGAAEVVDLNHEIHRMREKDVEEVWVHGMWLSKEWAACRMALRAGKRLVRMTHGSLSPIYLTRQSPLKKKLVSPVERYFLRRADKVVATCEAEAEWIRSYLGRCCPPIEVTDIKRFFKLSGEVSTQRREDAEFSLGRCPRPPSAEGSPISLSAHSAPLRLCVKNNEQAEPLHLLYLGRRHPLKGVEYLETAVRQIEKTSAYSAPLRLCVKIVSSAFGDELEKVWDWCDVLVLPTLSENFGLVIAEALERGKRVITTDGAPAWGENLSRVEHADHVEGGEMLSGYGGRLIYLKGYRDSSNETRVELLKSAIERMCK